MNAIIQNQLHTLAIPTADGQFLATYSQQGLCELRFPVRSRGDTLSKPTRVPPLVRRWHAATVKALRDAAAGRPPGKLPPLDLSGGSDFQQRVWRMLRRITRGRTWSYSQVAQALGQPKAARAVGGACGANPIPVLVPCHRVLAANHGLGGFSGGLKWKRALLAREGISFPLQRANRVKNATASRPGAFAR